MSLEKQHQGQPLPTPLPPNTPTQPTNHSVAPSTNRSASQPTSHSTHQLTHQSISQSTTPYGGKIVEKPKAFYITERLDKRLDEAVRYFQEHHGIRKVDRSTLVTVLLDQDANWTEEALN